MTADHVPGLPWVVVGGGPTAAATSVALARGGIRVRVLDTGLELEPERQEAKRRLATVPPEQWDAADLRTLTYRPEVSASIGHKRSFGSDVAFRPPGGREAVPGKGVGAVPSYAIGGLSNVWGAGLMSYSDADMEGWPLRSADLAPHYRDVLSFVPYSAADDALSASYPLLAPPDGQLSRSEGGEAIWRALSRRRHALARRGLVFGAARLAVRVGRPAPERGCVYCGRCLDGCPYDHIYNAAFTLRSWSQHPLVDYEGGVHVDRLVESETGVTLETTTLDTGVRSRVEAGRVFLAAGAVSSTMILQRSGFLPTRTELIDSATLYLPLLVLHALGAAGNEPEYTLAQVFALLHDDAVSRHGVHISLYSSSDGLLDRARAAHPNLAGVLGPGFDRLVRQMAGAICFLHSDDSDRFASVLEPHRASVRLESVPNPRKKLVLKRLSAALRATLGRAGLLPLTPLAEQSESGGGYHYGGSLPMHEAPRRGQADLLGRPADARRVHVVDSTVFPTIPGGTITLPAMANAYRIASESSRRGLGRW